MPLADLRLLRCPRLLVSSCRSKIIEWLSRTALGWRAASGILIITSHHMGTVEVGIMRLLLMVMGLLARVVRIRACILCR
jgi:hypothetical protein